MMPEAEIFDEQGMKVGTVEVKADFNFPADERGNRGGGFSYGPWPDLPPGKYQVRLPPISWGQQTAETK